MQIVVINGPLSEREQDACIRQITRKYPASAIEKLYLEVRGITWTSVTPCTGIGS